MAKLTGVKTVDMVNGEITKVAYDGAEYVKVEVTSPNDGDIAMHIEGSSRYTKGAFYKLRRGVTAHGSFGTYGDDESSGPNGMHPMNWVVFRKASAPAPSNDISSRLTKLEGRVDALKEATLSVGDYAKVVDGSQSCFKLGDILKITNFDGRHFLAERVSDGYDHYADTEGELVRATDAEVAEAKAELERKAESEKWAKIGRKPGEFKKGDIVKVTKGNGGVPVNAIGEVGELRSSMFRVNTVDIVIANWHRPEHVELITPVEARFDA